MQPAQGKKEFATTPQSGCPVGLWRDGRYLVIDLQRHEFPPRCVKSNATVLEPIAPFRISVEGADWMQVEQLRQQVEDANDEVKEWDARIRFRDQHRAGTEVIVDLRLPIAAEWRGRVQSPWSARFAGLGFALLGVFFGLQWSWQRGWIEDISYSLWHWAVIIACFLASWFLKWCQTRVVPVLRLEDGKLWLGGIRRDWLRGLPEFVPSRDFTDRRLGEQGPRLWVMLAISAIFFGLVLMCHAMRLQSEPLVRSMIAVYLLGGGVGILSANHARQRILQLKQQRRRYYPETDVATFRRKRSQQNA